MSEVIMPDLVAQDASCDAFFHALAGFTGVPFNPTDASDASSDDSDDLHDDLDTADTEQNHTTTADSVVCRFDTMNDHNQEQAEEDQAKVTFGASVGSDTRTDRTLEPAKDNHQLDGDDAQYCASPPFTSGARQGGGLTSSSSAGGAFKEDHAMHAAGEDPRAGCVEHPPNGTTAFEASTRTLATALAAEHPLRAEVLRDLSYITRSPQITAATSHLLLHLSHKFSDVAGVAAKDAKLAQIGESQEQELSVLVEAHDGEVDQLYLRSVVLKHQRQLAQHGSQWEQRRSRQYQDAVAEFVAFVRNAAKDIRRKEIAAATALTEASTSRAPSQGNSKKQPAGVSASRNATTTTTGALNLDKDEKGVTAAAEAKEPPAKRPTATALFPTTASSVKVAGSDESSDADERSPTTSSSPNGNAARPSSSSSPAPIGKSATIAGSGGGGTGSPSRATPQGKPTTPTPLLAQKQPPPTPTTVLSYPALPAVQDAGSIIEPGTRTAAARVRAVPASSALDGLGFSHTTACVSVDYGVEQLVPAALLTFPNPLAHVDRALQDPRPKPTRRHPHGPLSSQPLVPGGRRHSSSSHGAGHGHGHGHGAQPADSQKVDAAGGGSAPPSPIRGGGGGGTPKPRARQPTSRDPTLAAVSVEIGCVADLPTICTLSTNDNACALRTPYLMSPNQSTGTVATDGKSKKTAQKQSSAAKKASALSNAATTGGSVSGSYNGGGGAGGAGGGGNGGGSGSSGAQHPHLKTDHLDLDGRVALSTAEVDSAVARRLGKHLHRLTAQHRHGVMVLVGPPSEFGAMLAPALDTAIDPIVAFGQPSVSLLPQPSTASAAGSGGVRSTSSSWSPAPSPTNAGGGGGGSAAVQVPSSSRATGSVLIAAGAGSASARSGGFSPFSLSPKAPGSLSSAPQKQPPPPSASARFQDPREDCAGSPTEDVSAMAEFYNSFGPAILPNAFLCADTDEALSGRVIGAVEVQAVVSPHAHAAVTAFERMRHLAQAIVDGDLCVRSVPLEDITGLSVYLACVSGHHALHATHNNRHNNKNSGRKGQKRDHRPSSQCGGGGGGDCLSAVEVEGLRHELRMATSDIDGLVTASSLDACISLSPKNGGLDRPTSTSLDLQSQRLALHSPNTPTLQAGDGDSAKGKTAFGVGAGGTSVSQDRSAFAGIERDGRRKTKTAASTSRGLSAALGAVASTIATGHDIVLGFLASDICSASVAEAATRLVRSANPKKTNANTKLNDAAPQEIVGSDSIGSSEGVGASASATTTVDRQRGTGPLLSREEAVDLDDSLREVWATLCDVLFECPSAANAALAEISCSTHGLSLSGVRSPPPPPPAASAAVTSARSDSEIDNNGTGDDVRGGESDSSPFSKCLTQLLPALSSMLAVDNDLQQHQDGRQGHHRTGDGFGGKVSTARAAETAALVQALLKRRQRAVPSFVERFQASQESLSFFTQRLKAAAAFTALSAAEADLHAVIDACLNVCIARLADRLLSTSSSSSSIHAGSAKTRALANAASQQQGAQTTKKDQHDHAHPREDAKSSRPGSRPGSRPVSRPVSRRSSKVVDDDDDDDAVAATEAFGSRAGDAINHSSAQHRRNDTWCSVAFSEIIRNASNGIRNPTNPHAAGEGQSLQKSSGGGVGSHHPESCVVSAVPLRNGALWGGDLLLCLPRVEHCTAAFISAIVGHCVSDWTADLLTIAVAPSVGPSLGASVLSRVVDGIARVQRASSMVRLPNVAFPIPKPLPPSSYGFSLLTAYTDKSPYVRHAVDSYSPEPGSSGGNGSFNSASGGHHGGHHHHHQSTSRSAAGGVASALGKFAAGAGQAVTFGVLRRGGKDKDTTSVSDAETASSATGGSTPVAASPSAHAASHSMGLNTPPPKGAGLAGGGGGLGGGRGSPRMSRVTSDVAPTNTGVAVRVLLPVVDLSAARAIGATLNGVEVGCRDPARDLLKAAVTIATGDE